MTTHFACHMGRPACQGYDADIDMDNVTPETFEAIDAARDAHYAEHQAAELAAGNHIRKQINPRRIRTGNQFYKNRVQLGASENGSQTLCGAAATTQDMSWAETRFEKNLAFVSCEACKAARRAAA